MTIGELLGDEALRQREFPAAREKVFLAHAGVCPLPARVTEAMQRYVTACTQGDQEAVMPSGLIRQTRERAARLIGARPSEIALVGPTSLGLSFVAAGLKFQSGDNVLVYFDDYPSNVYPWTALAPCGVEVRRLNVHELGCIQTEDVMKQVDGHTRLVALASCHFLAGWRIDLAAIGEFLRHRGILFCVDGIQTVGAFPTPAQHFDFLAADAHKWMLGPCGAGILYVREEVQEQLEPLALGWNNVRSPGFVAQEEIVFRSGGQRYEAGTHSLIGLVGMNAALELLLEIGVENIRAELLRKRTRIVAALERKGCTVLGARAPEQHASGIVTFFRDGTDMAALHQRLEAAGIIASLRADRSGRRYVRFSPHFYNTDGEMDRALELI